MKNLIFTKFIIDATKTFIAITISIGLIVWVIQAVKFLDFVAEDGHSLKIYFLYTLLNLPKIIHRILPFIFFIALIFDGSQPIPKQDSVAYIIIPPALRYLNKRLFFTRPYQCFLTNIITKLSTTKFYDTS